MVLPPGLSSRSISQSVDMKLIPQHMSTLTPYVLFSSWFKFIVSHLSEFNPPRSITWSYSSTALIVFFIVNSSTGNSITGVTRTLEVILQGLIISSWFIMYQPGHRMACSEFATLRPGWWSRAPNKVTPVWGPRSRIYVQVICVGLSPSWTNYWGNYHLPFLHGITPSVSWWGLWAAA